MAEDEAEIRFRTEMSKLAERSRDLPREEVARLAAELLASLHVAVSEHQLQAAGRRRIHELLFDDALARKVSVDEAEALFGELWELDEPDRIHKAHFTMIFARYCNRLGNGGRALPYLRQAEAEILASADLEWERSYIETVLWHLRLLQAYLVDEPLDACEARLKGWLERPRGPEERGTVVQSFAEYCRDKGEPKRALPYLEDAVRALSEARPQDLGPDAPKLLARIQRYLADVTHS